MKFLSEDGVRKLLTNLKALFGNKLDATAQAADSAKLGGKSPSDYATAAQGTKADNALPAASQAVDSAKLGGKLPSEYAIPADIDSAQFAVNVPDYTSYITAIASISTDAGNPSSYTVQENGFVQIGTSGINGSLLAQTTLGVSVNGRKVSWENWDLTLYGAGNYSFGKTIPVKKGDVVTCHASRNTGVGSWASLYFIRPRKVPAPWSTEIAWIPDYANMESTNRISATNTPWTVDRDGFVQVYFRTTGGGSVRINGKDAITLDANTSNMSIYGVKRGDRVDVAGNGVTNILCYFIPPVAIVPPTINETYSTTEVNTGKKWIDGNPIYRRVFTGTTPASNALSIPLITGLSVPTIVDYGGVVSMNAGGTLKALGTYADSTSYTSLVVTTQGGAGTSTITLQGNRTTAIAGPYNIWVEYTKP